MDAHRVLTALYTFPHTHVFVEDFILCQSAEIFCWKHLVVVLRVMDALQRSAYIEKFADIVDFLVILFANTISVMIRFFPELAIHDGTDTASFLFNDIRSHKQCF